LVSTPPKDWPATATNTDTGTVEYANYEPKHVELSVAAAAPSILLLNDKYDPNWSVTVDGKPAELLRCNYIMRGVCLTSGEHKVVFSYGIPKGPLLITLSAFAVGLLLAAVLIWHKWRHPGPAGTLQ
jgi:uncharacterized membrane protein YfhO